MTGYEASGLLLAGHGVELEAGVVYTGVTTGVSRLMEFEWDEAKRRLTIDTHGLDFLDVAVLFAGPTIEAPARLVGVEVRWLATGMIEDVAATVVFTRRGGVVRVISFRRARRAERACYDACFGG